MHKVETIHTTKTEKDALETLIEKTYKDYVSDSPETDFHLTLNFGNGDYVQIYSLLGDEFKAVERKENGRLKKSLRN